MSNEIRFTPTEFGDMLNYPRPDDCDLIVLCVDLGQHKPVSVLLPHQIYRERLIELKDEYPNALGFTILPVRCSEKYYIPTDSI